MIKKKMPKAWRLIAAGFALLSIPGQSAFAGQSLVLTPGTEVSPVINSNLPATQAWRVEFQLHSWAPPTTNTIDGTVWDLNGIGANSAVQPDGSLRITDKRDIVSGGSPCSFSLGTLSNVLVRVQRDPVNRVFTCELWNYDGTGYQSSSVSILSFLSWPYSNGGFGSSYTTADLGFFRIFNSLVPAGSQPPVTATVGNLLNLKFDGNLTDSSGRGNSVSFAGATFVPTPNQGPSAFLSTLGAPYWTNWISLRAGYPATLDGTKSFSLADSSAAVTYRWQQVSGPTTVRWLDRTGRNTRTIGQATIQGLIFGTYRFRLQVTDVSGQTATTDLDVGAVATDNNHVVIYPDDRLYAILGPMIAYGYDPWAYVDYKQLQLEEYWGNQFAIHGGTWDYEPDLTSYMGVPRSGTAYLTDAATVAGIGTNFGDVFCNGMPLPCSPTVPGSYIQINVPLAGSAPQTYYREVMTINSQTSLTLAQPWEYPGFPTSPGYSWGTFGICTVCGNWASANNTTSNLNYYDGQGLGNYAFYYRSGWNKPQQTAQFVADHWYRSGFRAAPRDFFLTSAMIRATIDTSPAPAYNAWPYLHNQLNGGGFTAGSPTVSCTVNTPAVTSGQISDARENGSCLIYRATQALLDPDPANQTIARTYLVNALAGMWQGQQQPAGNWVQNSPGGNTTWAIQLSNGSTTATLAHGPNFPSTLCGENNARLNNVGSISVGPDRLTVTGSVDFIGSGVSPGDVLVATGTLAGSPRSFTTTVASVTSSSVLVLALPWRGDIGTLSFYRLYMANSGLVGNTGYATQYFVNGDSQGNLVFPFTQDADNFYICSVTNGTTLTLDKPYTGQTSVNPYRVIVTTDLDGPGTQPYMMGFAELGAAIANAALAGVNPPASAGYNTALTNGANWLWNAAYDTVNGGMWYGYGFTNCANLQGNLWPAYGCSGGYLAQNQDYAVETGNAFARHYLLTGAATDKTNGDTMYNGAYAAPGYAAPPGFTTNPNYGDLLNCCDVFTLTKYYGQVFALGQAASWPAARLGGVQPAIPVNSSISFNMSGIAGAVSARVIVTQPSGIQTAFNCSASPCQITADARQGSHWFQIEYLAMDGSVLAKSQPDLLLLD